MKAKKAEPCTWCHGKGRELALEVMGTPEIPCRMCDGVPVHSPRNRLLLDTREKVAWAIASFPGQHFRIGDHCRYRPRRETWDTTGCDEMI